MKFTFALFTALIMSSLTGFSQGTANASDKEAEYTRTIQARAEKIVATLNISDSAKFHRVSALIANQYRNLNQIHTSRNEKIKTLKAQPTEKETIEREARLLEEGAVRQLDSLHKVYLTRLGRELTEEQVVKVKDGMTYGVLPLTYNAYLDMLPKLTGEQKEQIMKWLVEARELAMDAESSEKKHGWFGKYKGRINNYLSAAGYDLKKEGAEWEKRKAAARAASN